MNVTEPFRLKGRKALITGASRGIGRAIALAFADAGAELVLTATNADRLARVAHEVAFRGARAHAIAADLRDPAATLDVVDRAHAAMGGLSVVVNNAGLTLPADDDPASISLEAYDRLVAVNFRAPVFIMQRAGVHMKAGGGGVIINISSIAAARGSNVYGAAKAALESYTRGLARAWGRFGIRVVALAPGLVATDMSASVRADSQVMAAVLAQTYLGRVGTPEEVASAAVFLASDAASFITDAVLPVSGGRVLLY
ncbi:MAG: SDR family oxidoreductase [Actinobacteria bacterium]|nr:SDR family oxidoreductase [Actinomycetota bacterium]